MDFIIDSTILQSLLLSVIFLAILVEIKTGGTGIGALLGIIAAGVFFGSSYVKGLVSLYQIAIFIVGIIFIIIEILTPTIGLLAGLGVVAILYYKPYAIAAMMFLQKVADPAATLKALDERNTARWLQA